MYKHFADRESSFFDQIVAPTLRKNPDARRTAAQTLANLSSTSRKFKQALLRTNLRDSLRERVKRRAAAGAAAFLPLLPSIVQASWLRDAAPRPRRPRLGPAQRIAVPVRVAALCPPTRSGPRIDAPAVVLMDLAAGQVLYQRAAASARPVAEPLKLMTALLVLEAEEGRAGSNRPRRSSAVFGRGSARRGRRSACVR